MDANTTETGPLFVITESDQWGARENCGVSECVLKDIYH